MIARHATDHRWEGLTGTPAERNANHTSAAVVTRASLRPRISSTTERRIRLELHYGWRAAFLVSALGPLLAALSVVLLIRGRRPAVARTLSLGALFPLAAWRRSACRPCGGRLHLRLRGALPGAFGSRALDGGIPRVFGQPCSQVPSFPWHAGGDRCRDQPDRGAGFDREATKSRCDSAGGAGSWLVDERVRYAAASCSPSAPWHWAAVLACWSSTPCW